MTELTSKLLFLLFGLYVGVLSWILKTAWDMIRSHGSEIERIRLECSRCQQSMHTDTTAEISELLAQISTMIDTKLDAWWSKIELNLMNDGRLPPRRQSRKDNS